MTYCVLTWAIASSLGERTYFATEAEAIEHYMLAKAIGLCAIVTKIA